MQNRSKVHIFLFIIYIIAVFIGILGSLLTVGFSGGSLLYYLSFTLFMVGFVLLLVSQSKAETDKKRESLIYGVFAFVACIGGYLLNSIHF